MSENDGDLAVVKAEFPLELLVILVAVSLYGLKSIHGDDRP
jgi:hypothetical protein